MQKLSEQQIASDVEDDVTPATLLPWHYQEESDAYTHIIRGPHDEYVACGPQDSRGKTERDIRYLVQCVNNAQVLQSKHEAEMAELRERLAGPVTDEEVEKHSIRIDDNRLFLPGGVDSLLRYRRSLMEPKPNALQQFVNETYGTRETLGPDKYHELLGAAKVQQEYFQRRAESKQ